MNALAPSNPRVQRLRRLSGRRSVRSEEGAYLIEGPVLVGEAISAGVDIEAIYAEAAGLDEPVVAAADAVGIPSHLVRDAALAKVLDQRSPRPLVAVARQRLVHPHLAVQSAAESGRPLLVAVELSDPGNAGTLIRVGEASGCVGFAAVGRSVDVHNPKTVRASAGSLFRLPVAQVDEFDALADALAAAGVRLIGTTGRNDLTDVTPAVVIDDIDLGGAFALLIGNEAHGLPADVLARCDAAVTIPMDGAVESLNAAAAGAVILFEAARRRRARERSGGVPAPLGHNEPRPGNDTEDPLDV